MSFNALGDIESSIPVSPLHLAVSALKPHSQRFFFRHVLVPNSSHPPPPPTVARQADKGHWQALRVLTETAAYVDMQDAAGRSVLYLAAQKGYTRCVEVLLAQGASCLLNDNRLMWTPIHVAGTILLPAHFRMSDLGCNLTFAPHPLCALLSCQRPLGVSAHDDRLRGGR